MSSIKNISLIDETIDDIGLVLAPNEIIDIKDIDLEDYRRSVDLPLMIDSGTLIVLDNTGFPLSTIQSSSFITDNQEIDLSKYYTIDQVTDLLNSLPDGGIVNKITDIVKLPLWSVYYKKLIYNKYNPDTGNFYKYSNLFYYNNLQVSTEQKIITINGKGVFSGLILPRLKSSTNNDSTVKITMIVDGVETTETIKYQKTNSTSYRLFLGGLLFKEPPRFEYIVNSNNATTDRRLTDIGYITSTTSNILHKNQLDTMPSIPRVNFETSLTIKVQTNSSDVFSTSKYAKRFIVIAHLGE
jgi:hypothetical protein